MEQQVQEELCTVLTRGDGSQNPLQFLQALPKPTPRTDKYNKYSPPLLLYDHMKDILMWCISSENKPTYMWAYRTAYQPCINRLNTFASAKDHLQPYVGNMFPLSLSQAAPKQACGSRHSSAHTAKCLHNGTLCLSREYIMVQAQTNTLLINVFNSS